MATSCNVCFNDFSKINKAIECPSCPSDRKTRVCTECTKDYLLESPQGAHCMSCKHQWSHAFMADTFNKTFLTGLYRKSRQAKALEREKGLLPQTIGLVEEEKRRRKVAKKLQKMQKDLNALRKKQAAEVREMLFKISEERLNLNGGEAKEEKSLYMFPCPEEECRGYIEAKKYVCGICEVKICRKCHAVKDTDHECVEEDVETAKMVKKDTKPCPKCSVRIFKIHGCFAPETEILLFSGNTIKAKNVEIGMELMGDDGTPRIVEKTFSGVDTMHRIDQEKGISYTVSEHHTLVLQKWDNTEPVLITVYEYMNLKYMDQYDLMGYKSNGQKTEIRVTKLEKGVYNGFSVSGNKRFVLPDLTIGSNCDQMFCTNCHTAFSWDKGTIVTGVIHNPHYYELQNKLGRAPRAAGDIVCGGIPEWYFVDQCLHDPIVQLPPREVVMANGRTMMQLQPALITGRAPVEISEYMSRIHRRSSEIQETVRHKRHRLANNGLEDLRVEFLIGDIQSEDAFKRNIFLKERNIEKITEELQILDTFLASMSERFNDLIAASEGTGYNEKRVKKFIRDTEKIQNFCNEAFERNWKAMGFKKIPQIDFDVWYR